MLFCWSFEDKNEQLFFELSPRLRYLFCSVGPTRHLRTPVWDGQCWYKPFHVRPLGSSWNGLYQHCPTQTGVRKCLVGPTIPKRYFNLVQPYARNYIKSFVLKNAQYGMHRFTASARYLTATPSKSATVVWITPNRSVRTVVWCWALCRAGRCCCLGWKWRLGSWWSFCLLRWWYVVRCGWRFGKFPSLCFRCLLVWYIYIYIYIFFFFLKAALKDSQKPREEMINVHSAMHQHCIEFHFIGIIFCLIQSSLWFKHLQIIVFWIIVTIHQFLLGPLANWIPSFLGIPRNS